MTDVFKKPDQVNPVDLWRTLLGEAAKDLTDAEVAKLYNEKFPYTLEPVVTVHHKLPYWTGLHDTQIPKDRT